MKPLALDKVYFNPPGTSTVHTCIRHLFLFLPTAMTLTLIIWHVQNIIDIIHTILLRYDIDIEDMPLDLTLYLRTRILILFFTQKYFS